jgi:hypothetical protein
MNAGLTIVHDKRKDVFEFTVQCKDCNNFTTFVCEIGKPRHFGCFFCKKPLGRYDIIEVEHPDIAEVVEVTTLGDGPKKVFMNVEKYRR